MTSYQHFRFFFSQISKNFLFAPKGTLRPGQAVVLCHQNGALTAGCLGVVSFSPLSVISCLVLGQTHVLLQVCVGVSEFRFTCCSTEKDPFLDVQCPPTACHCRHCHCHCHLRCHFRCRSPLPMSALLTLSPCRCILDSTTLNLGLL